MITVKEVADYFKVTSRTVYRWIEKGAPFTKIGSKHYADSIDEVINWLKE